MMLKDQIDHKTVQVTISKLRGDDTETKSFSFRIYDTTVDEASIVLKHAVRKAKRVEE